MRWRLGGCKSPESFSTLLPIYKRGEIETCKFQEHDQTLEQYNPASFRQDKSCAVKRIRDGCVQSGGVTLTRAVYIPQEMRVTHIQT